MVSQERWCIPPQPSQGLIWITMQWKTQFRKLENVSHDRRLNHNIGKYRGDNCQVHKQQINGTISSCFLLLLKKHYLYLETSCTWTPKSSQFSTHFLWLCLQNKVLVNYVCCFFQDVLQGMDGNNQGKEQTAGLFKSKGGITLLSLKICSKKSTSSVKRKQTRILYNLTSKNQRQFWWRQGPKSKQNSDSTFS